MEGFLDETNIQIAGLNLLGLLTLESWYDSIFNGRLFDTFTNLKLLIEADFA
jgi:hypothetical protein